MKKSHTCNKVDSMCDVCLRPYMDKNLFKDLAATVQMNFCVKTIPAEILDVKCVTCQFCKKVGQSTLCLELHKRYKCKNLIECSVCKKSVRLMGKYSKHVRKIPVDKHDNCDEVFCHVCRDYVSGFDNPRNPSHVCYVKPVTTAKPWPSLITAFDFETFPCDVDGNMSVNVAHLITQETKNSPNSDFLGVFFTDIPMENVKLNGQIVTPGKEYKPDMSDDLKAYYPLELLKRAVAGASVGAGEDMVDGKQKPRRNKGRDRSQSPVDDPIRDEPYDPELCHFLRNPECINLKVTDPVKAHIDIYETQLQCRDEFNTLDDDTEQETGVTDDEEEVSLSQELMSKRKKGLDWRKALRNLERDDQRYVDGIAKYVSAEIDEEEAHLEEEEYLKRVRAFETREKQSKRKRHLAGFFSLEAKEVDESEDEDEPRETRVEDEELFLSVYGVPKPKRPAGGGVPGEVAQEIDEKIYEMQDEENVQKLLEDCLNWQKECDSDTVAKLVESENKFCPHETDEEFKKRMDIYENANPAAKSCAIRQFAVYILQPKFRNSVFLGMYSSGFDNHFVFSELVNMGVRVEPIYRGNKLLTFKIPFLNIRFLDFFCFVPSSLKNLEKSFNLNTGSKGYFPDLLNHPKHYGLELPHLPPKKFYEPELMKKDDLESFEKWYSENSNKPFKFAQEILTYCELDVKILLAACLTFVKETLIQQTEFKGTLRKLDPNGTIFEFANREKVQPNLVHPFSNDVCTLSSYANCLFRSYYLPENYLPIITHDVEETYSARSSKEELEYLSYFKKVNETDDLEFGNEFRGQRKFAVFCEDSQKSWSFYVDGYSPSKKVIIKHVYICNPN